MKVVPLSVNSRLIEVCNNKKIRQKELIEAGCGSQQTVNNVWHSRQKPKIDFIVKLMDIIPELNANWLLSGIGYMFAEKKSTSLIFEESKDEYGFCMSCVKKDGMIKILEKQAKEKEQTMFAQIEELGKLKNQVALLKKELDTCCDSN